MTDNSSVSARVRFKEAYRASRSCMNMFDTVASAAQPFFDRARTAVNLNTLLVAVDRSVRSDDAAIERAVRIARDPLASDPLRELRCYRNISTAVRRDLERSQSKH
jgi:hypothetical protein